MKRVKLSALILAVMLVFTSVLPAFAADEIKYEAESTPFTVTDNTGKTTSVSKESKWAWSLKLTGAKNVSGDLTYFRSGGVGGTVDFKINVENAGEYSLKWAYRPHDTSASHVQVMVNGENIGGEISLVNGDIVGGKPNTEQTVRDVILGNANFTKGENIVSFKMTKLVNESEYNSALTVDYFSLGAPVDESKLTFTEAPIIQGVATKENSTPVKVEIPEGMLDPAVTEFEAPKTTDKITVYPLADCYSETNRFTLTADGVHIPTTAVDGDYDYGTFDYDPSKGEIEIKISGNQSFKDALLSPQISAPALTKGTNEASFKINACGKYVLKVGDRRLVISADPMQERIPDSEREGIFNVTKAPYLVSPQMSDAERTAAFQKALDDASAYGSIKGNKNGTVYVPAGVYSIGNLRIGSNTNLYLEGSAALRITKDKELLSIDGCKTSMSTPDGKGGLDYTWWISTKFSENNGKTEGSYDIKIYGRGTIDSRGKAFWNESYLGSNTVIPIAASYFTLKGVTVREAVCWSILSVRSNNMTFEGLKIFQSMDMGENDCIDICESQDVTVKNCIGFSLDDPFSAKTWPKKVGITVNWPGEPEYQENVTFENNIAYTHCYGFKIGQGTDQDQYNVTFKNCVTLDGSIGFGIHCKSGNGTVYNAVFDGCSVEDTHGTNWDHSSWFVAFLHHNARGDANIRGITVKNITVYKDGVGTRKLAILGYNEESTVENVTFENITVEGKTAKTLEDIRPALETNEFVSGVKMANGEDKPSSPDTPDAPNNPDTPSNPDMPDTPNNLDTPKDESEKPNNTLVVIGAVLAILVLGGVSALIIFKTKRERSKFN